MLVKTSMLIPALKAFTKKRDAVVVVTDKDIQTSDTIADGGTKFNYTCFDLNFWESQPVTVPVNPFNGVFSTSVFSAPNRVIVRHGFYCGQDARMTIYVRWEDIDRIFTKKAKWKHLEAGKEEATEKGFDAGTPIGIILDAILEGVC
jgi:predicted carbohydrate-binding protein with CBM5 and CBM33 domain